MKSKSKKLMLGIVLTLLCSFNSKAFTFINNLTCPVTIVFEMWDINSNGCWVCKNLPITVFPTTPVVISDCIPLDGICIVISDIGGTAPPSNHVSTSTCHAVTPYGQSGSVAGCSNSGTWSATVAGLTWKIS